MVFSSLFGKRDKPEPAESESPTSESTTKLGLFDRMKQAVTRTRETFSESISSVIALTREVDEASLTSLEPLLLAADIGSATTAIIMENLRQRALRTGIQSGAELKQLLKQELKQVLDNVAHPIQHPASPPEVIMMVGVNGTGKTTTTGKLAAFYRNQNKSVLLCAADTFRAAAIEQLEIWAQRSDVPIIKTKQGGDPSAALYDACTAAKARNTDILIADTAGRLHTKSDLMKELDKMRRTAEKLSPWRPASNLPRHGRDHRTKRPPASPPLHRSRPRHRHRPHQARRHRQGRHRPGHRHRTKLPVIYAGVGEKIEDLIPFDSATFIDSLLD